MTGECGYAKNSKVKWQRDNFLDHKSTKQTACILIIVVIALSNIRK